MHGARGGAPKGEANGNYKTGEHTAELREARRLVRAILRRAKEAEAIGVRIGASGCVWDGRIVSEAALSSRINAAHKAVGDSGNERGAPLEALST